MHPTLLRHTLLVLLLLPCLAWAQQNPYPATKGADRLGAYGQRRAVQASSRISEAPIRNIGPTVMSGRVADLDVNPGNPTEFYVAYASGGLWYTADNGISFTPVFDTVATLTIGDIAVNWQTGSIWVGTGEANSSRSSYAGSGVYLSTDKGKTWQHRGLPESHHISKIVLHPTDAGTAWVAALGHLYSNNPERGIYKTTDGGKSWLQTLAVNDSTGGSDLAIDPNNPNVLWAGMWERSRRAWRFQESGAGSGIWRSEDGGTSWTKVSTPTSGFPTGEVVGRIGLSVQSSEIVFAVVDNQTKDTKPAGPDRLVTADKLKTISKEAFLALPADSLNQWLDDNGFPAEYTAGSLFADVKAGKYVPADLAKYVDRGDDGFSGTVRGCEVHRSADGGKTWARTHEKPLKDVYSTYGYYFGQVRVAPSDPNVVYTWGVPFIGSADGGKTWASLDAGNVHSDHHALWIHPTNPKHLILGNDGGLNISYDGGKHWVHCNTPPVAQFYAVQVDLKEPYNVYGGLQDNGVWKGTSAYRADNGWYSEGRYPYQRLYGGDGMQVMVDPRDGTVYTGYQFGNYARISPDGEEKEIQPQHKLGERPLRFNWQTPIWLSKHNPDIIYFGANRVYRSLNRGDNWEAISPDLTTNPAQGDVPYGTLSCLVESPHAFGVLYAGTDDGRVHLTKDGGVSWQDISAGLPQNLWVSRVEVSPINAATVFVSLNGYRWDNFDAHLYRSTDYGLHWTRLGTNLPAEPINVVRQDLKNANVLYVGTDHGLYISLDGGQTFEGYANPGFPEVAVHDMLLHPKVPDLVIGTHGRSLYVLDVQHIRALTPEVLASDLMVFEIEPTTYSARWGVQGYAWREATEPQITIGYYSASAGTVEITVADEQGNLVKSMRDTAKVGINYFVYDGTSQASENKPVLRKAQTGKEKPKGNEKETPAPKAAPNGKTYLVAGKYTIQLNAGGMLAKETLEVKPARVRKPRTTAPASSPDEGWEESEEEGK